MHDARARLAGWMNACDRPASQRAHGWLAGWLILTEDYIPMHERPGSRARVLKVVRERLAVMGGMYYRYFLDLYYLDVSTMYLFMLCYVYVMYLFMLCLCYVPI
eukprot:COSAG05_NODE_3_length_51333_cov_129.132080_28_plen_104_part_00